MKSEYHGEKIDEQEKEGEDVRGSFSVKVTGHLLSLVQSGNWFCW